MDSGEEAVSFLDRAHSPEQPTFVERSGGAVDLETHTGLNLSKGRAESSDMSESDLEQNSDVRSETDNESLDSIILDILHAQGSEDNIPDDIKISKEECEALKAEVRRSGGDRFIQNYYLTDKPNYSVKQILYAFGCVLPEELEFTPETTTALFRLAVETELQRRKKLDDVNTIDDVVNLIKSSNNIIVLAGAGISTSCGIPDFRSDKGIYAMLADYGLQDPHDMFDIEVFRHDPSIFYSFARQILPSTTTYSPTHAFLRLLQDKNKLLRVYTQNIDNLEQLAGIREDKLVQCHGSFATASCMRCKRQVCGDEIREDVMHGEIPKCPACEAEREQQARQKGKKRKRGNDWDDDDDGEQDDIIEGIMKPDITFFGEALSKKFDYSLLGSPSAPDSGDVWKCDLLLCMGTSLKVAPVSEIIGVLPASVPQIYISKTPVTHIQFDTMFLGNCDDIIRDLVRRCGYNLTHEKLKGGKSDVGENAKWKQHQPGVYEIEAE